MRISGIEPSSVILSQTKYFKDWKVMPKSAETSLSQKGWCNKPTKLQFQSILPQKILMLLNATNQPKFDRRTLLHVPSGTLWSTSSDTHQVVEI